jgi:hypothetical protein
MIVATDVIRMGRSRIRPASSAEATVSSPRSGVVDVFHQEDRVLGDQPDEQDHADLAVDVDGRARDQQR